MSARVVVGGGGLVGGLLVLPMVLSAALSGQQAAQQPGGGGGGVLDATAIPAQYVALVQAAGATCPDESAPLIAAQIQQESAWNPNATSSVGAQGIAQFMPGTWAQYGNGGNVFDPNAAIPAQARLMCALFSQVHAAMASGRITKGTAQQNALAAYNAGLGNVLASGGFPTGIGQTDDYVPRIEALAAKFTAAPAGGVGGVPGSAGAAAAIGVAKRYLGIPYVWGGGDLNGPTGYLDSPGPPVGFDCSGLTRYAMYQATHIDIGAGTVTQINSPALQTVATRTAGGPMPLDQMAPGDVVLINFHPSPDGAWGHVALYEGGGQFIHAPHTGEVIQEVPASWFGNADWIVRRLK